MTVRRVPLVLLACAIVLASCARRAPEPGGEPDPDTLYAGAWVTDTLPSADSRGLVVALQLDSSHVATLTSDHLDGSEPVTDHGAWYDLTGGRVRVTLAAREPGLRPDTVDFERHGNRLRHVGHRFGSQPIELGRVQGVRPASPENPR